MSVHFMSQRMDWKTPKAVYQVLDAEFQFDHDPTPANWDGVTDGLVTDWGHSPTTSILRMAGSCRSLLRRATTSG